jgi:dCTP deaminase
MHQLHPVQPQGILPARAIAAYCAAGTIGLGRPLDDDQIQPASLDLRLGRWAYRVRASFLPGPRSTVAARLESLSLHRIDLTDGAVLETGCVYIVPLLESLELPAGVAAAANPKSSTGRLDIFTRVITDHAQAFDTVPDGYRGPLYAEISPRTFSILARTGSRLSQIRFRAGATLANDELIRELHSREPLITNGEANIDGGLAFTVDLSGTGSDCPVGYRAKRHSGLIDVDRPGAAEMVPFNPLVGEFRVHYAGFFDPGFGHSSGHGEGARAVLEVRSHEVPFILEDGQIIGRLVYEPLTEAPERVYGQGIGSNYQKQGLKLSKHFKPFKPART